MDMLRTALLGAGAGALAGLVQPAAGKLEEALVFRPGEDTDIPVHLVRAVETRFGVRLDSELEWLAGAVFHIGYALTWGALFALARERLRLQPTVAALALAALLYTIAFSDNGVASKLRSEPPPQRRPGRYWLLTLTMPLVYAVTTAYTYERLRRL
jgi:ribose/xylose/arabinose/galactoside ABC-type transport system permease subunit